MTNHEDRVQALMTAGDRLDDVKRARLWARLEARLPVDGARPDVAARRWWAAVAGGALAVAAGIALWLGLHGAAPRTLDAPADATLTAMVGPYARVAVVGPARVEVGAQGEVSSLHVTAGTLLAEFEGGPGRALHVAAPGVDVEVVGTLFAVAVDGPITCVSVAHGRVRVTRAADRVMVGGGERLCSSDPRPGTIDPAVRDALTRHEQLIAAGDPRSASGSAVVPSSVPPNAPAAQLASPSAPPSVPPAPPDRLASQSPVAPAPRDPLASQGPVAPALTSSPVAPRDPVPRIPAAPARDPASRIPVAPAPRDPASRVPVAPTPRDPIAAVGTPRPTASEHGAISPAVPTDGKPTEPPRATDGDHPARPAQPGSVEPPPARTVGTAPTAGGSLAPDRRPPTTPASPVEPVPQVTAETLYRSAEAALARGDAAAADRALARIVDDFAGSALFDQALYERARLAFQRHAWSQARRDLDRLAAVSSSALAEPGQYLACRVALAAHDADVARCFAAYRATYPRSPHALDVLALLVELAHADGGCRAAQPLIGELVHDHPTAVAARTWRARCPESR